MNTIKATVANWRIVSTKYGKRLVLNTTILNSNQQAAVWSKNIDNPSIKSQRQGTIVELEIDENGKYLLVEHPVSSVSSQTLEEQTDLLSSEQELYLPPEYSEAQLSQIIILAGNRAKVLVGCIGAVKAELAAQGEELNDNSIRSLGVSLFIQVSRYLE